jgi:hypothetical protein
LEELYTENPYGVFVFFFLTPLVFRSPGAAVARDDAVRKHFDAIVWCPLGQTPVVSKMQNLCHMQCTGTELSPELASEEKKEALQQAMSGKRILLCLDGAPRTVISSIVLRTRTRLDINYRRLKRGFKSYGKYA